MVFLALKILEKPIPYPCYWFCFPDIVVPLLTYLLTKEDLTPKEVNGHAIDVVAAAVDNVSKVVRPQSLHFLPTGDCKFLYMYATNVAMFSSRKSPYSLEFP